MLTTTLKLLKQADACSDGMQTLLASLGKDWPEEKEIELAHILQSNGLDHAIWSMQATTINCKQQIVFMAMDFALQCIDNFESVYSEDKRPRLAIEAAGKFVRGEITIEELSAARAAAQSAVQSAVQSAAWAAARVAAQSAAQAARAAARAAAQSAVQSAAWAAAQAAALAVQSAAWAAQAAARVAAQSAAQAARAAIEKQNKEIFLKHIS